MAGGGVSTIAVLGMPNTGKSTLFNQLTGSHAHIGNWPGLTVDLMQAQLRIEGQTVQLVDLPGIYDLRGHSEDEAVVRRFRAGPEIARAAHALPDVHDLRRSHDE
mgnify:CR=1 FL=1